MVFAPCDSVTYPRCINVASVRSYEQYPVFTLDSARREPINETLLVPKQVVQLQAVTGKTQNVDRQQGGPVDADGEHLRRLAHRVPTQCPRRQAQPPTQEQTRAISSLLPQGNFYFCEP